ncbi:hypothetical protein EV702DRAFT_1200118 [Suillus placidus]|uniref:Uncharacterized protein n=1 Tax=Suillus placidus TaxID=48579 RepID=A0A9P6ZS20_9AGAM|nr:hypothetical protein EV702DRAFT_1200118 [Suillus placidus]
MKTYRAMLPVSCKDSENGSQEDENEEYDSEYRDRLGDSINACVSQIEEMFGGWAVSLNACSDSPETQKSGKVPSNDASGSNNPYDASEDDAHYRSRDDGSDDE